MKKYAKIIEIFLIVLILICVITLITYPKRIDVYGNKYLTIEKKLDLSNIKIDDYGKLKDAIDDFDKLKILDLGNNEIKNDEFNKLSALYPDLQIKAIKVYNVYGAEIRENVEIIDFKDVKVNDDVIDYLKYFPNLKKVDLSGQNISIDYELKLIKEYPSIDFTFDVPIIDITVSSDTTKLDLSNKVIKNIEEFKNSLKLLKNLKYLYLGVLNLSNEQIEIIQKEFPNVDIEWTINFENWHINTNDTAFSVLIADFSYIPLKSEDLSFLKYCKKLKALDLGHQNITNLDVIADNLPELRILILADNKITDISPLKKLKHLHYLELFINNITDISPLEENKELVDLNLCYNRINNYESLLGLNKLERLWIVQAGISYKDYETLKNHYSNSDVVFYGKGSTDSGWRTHERYFKMIKSFKSRTYDDSIYDKYE